jgi:hypothetical protein
MSEPRLDYETPQPPPPHPIGWVPWVGIGVCLAIILAAAILLVHIR